MKLQNQTFWLTYIGDPWTFWLTRFHGDCTNSLLDCLISKCEPSWFEYLNMMKNINRFLFNVNIYVID